MSGIGTEDAFLATLLGDDVVPVKRKAVADASTSARKRQASEPRPATPGVTKIRIPRQSAQLRIGDPSRGTPGMPPLRHAEVGRGRALDTRPGGLRPPKRTSEASPLGELVDVTGAALEKAVQEALDVPCPPDVFDAALDARDCLAKMASAITLLTSALAQGANISSAELKGILEKSDRVGGEPMMPVRVHKAEKERMQGEYESMLAALRSDVTGLKDVVAKKETEINELDKTAAKVKHATDKRIDRLKESNDRTNELLTEARSKLAKVELEVTDSVQKLDMYKEFMRVEVPKSRRACYRRCLENMLKKIVHKYPEADMSYFADVADIPDVEIDPSFLSAYAETETVATEEGEGVDTREVSQAGVVGGDDGGCAI